jgi:hypothetical protein
MQINGGNGGCGVQLVGNISWNVFINGTGWLTIECKDASGMKWHSLDVTKKRWFLHVDVSTNTKRIK